MIKKINIKEYSLPNKKSFCEGKCDREEIGNVLLCHGCKRIILIKSKIKDGVSR